MKIRIYCEGDTERGLEELFAPLREELRLKSIALETRPVPGNAKLLNKIRRATANEIREGAPAVFLIVDLHNIQDAFTEGMKNALGARKWMALSVDEQVAWLKSQIREQCVDKEHQGKFHPHVAVHEIEALIFSDPDIIKKRLKARTIGRFPPPEQIDFDNPPSKRMNELFRRYLKNIAYKKTLDGYKFLKSLDLQQVCEKCPYFADFVNDLRSINP